MGKLETLLSVKGLVVLAGTKKLLDTVSFNIHKGDSLGVFGVSGAGKSMLLNTICGLHPDTLTVQGNVYLHGEDVTLAPPEDRGLHGISLVPQRLALFPLFSVLDNIAYPLKCRGVRRKERNRKAQAVAKQFEIEGLVDRRPDQISGGQQQRVALARAVVSNPELLLLDEPFKELDDSLHDELLILFERVKESGVSILLVTHRRETVAQITDRTIFLQAGRIVADGPTESFITHQAEGGATLGKMCMVPGVNSPQPRRVLACNISVNTAVGVFNSTQQDKWSAMIVSKRPVSAGRHSLLLEFQDGLRTWWEASSKSVESMLPGTSVIVEINNIFKRYNQHQIQNRKEAL